MIGLLLLLLATPPEPEAVVAGFVAAYNDRDYGAIEAALAPDAKWYAVEGDKIAVEGADGTAIAAWIRNYLGRDCVSCRSELVSVASSGRFVSTVERAEWTGKDGRCLTQAGPAVYEVTEGRIRAVWYFPASDRAECSRARAGRPVPDRLPPVDQCAADPSFAAFRTVLKAAVDRRDSAALLAIVADDISVDFGGGAGRDYFAKTWRLDRPRESGLWGELGEAIRLGCTLSEGRAAAPAMFTSLPETADPFATVVATTAGSALHAAADPASPVVQRLDWHIMTVGEWDGTSEWLPVALPDGRRGYVRRAHVRFAIDHRAIFEKHGGRWRMTAFIAGD